MTDGDEDPTRISELRESHRSPSTTIDLHKSPRLDGLCHSPCHGVFDDSASDGTIDFVEPLDELPGADLGLLKPAPDEVHDLVPYIVRNPDPGQSSPSVFFNATWSAINSAKTSPLVGIFFKPTSSPQLRDRLLVQQVPAQNGDFFFLCVMLPLLLHAFSPLPY